MSTRAGKLNGTAPTMLLLLPLGAALAGCGARPTATLPADAFVLRQPVVGPGSNQPVDRPGPLVYEGQHPPTRSAGGPEKISQTVRESVQSPTAEAEAAGNGSDFPAPMAGLGNVAPAATQPIMADGSYQVLGSVVAVVNGQPIFADKVIATLDRALRAEARKNPPDRFKNVAAELVGKQIRTFVDNELEFAAADRALDAHDKEMATVLTTQWRREQVNKAGGSEAMARQRYADNGLDFEEQVQQQFRLNMTRIYYQKKIFPLIQVTSQDMRQFYQANQRKYDQPAAARFRVIWVGIGANGGREAALDRATNVFQRASRGEDFAELATKFNDDPRLKDSKGAVGDAKGWMEKGAYAVPAVEEAVWNLQPGQVTPPVRAADRGRDGFFVAQLEELHPGTVEPFESQKVQDDIYEELRREQFARLREKHRRELIQKAIITPNPNGDVVAMEMVMQRYGQWVAAR